MHSINFKFFFVAIALVCISIIFYPRENYSQNTSKAPLASGLYEGIEFPPHWDSCKNDQECEVIPGLCGAWLCVNKQFSIKLKEQIHHKQLAIDCLFRIIPKPEAICSDGTCKLKNSTDPFAQEKQE
jgi:hypothetical protein